MPPMAAKPLRTLGVHSRVPPVRVSDEGQCRCAARQGSVVKRPAQAGLESPFSLEEHRCGATGRGGFRSPTRPALTTHWPSQTTSRTQLARCFSSKAPRGSRCAFGFRSPEALVALGMLDLGAFELKHLA